MSVGKIGLLILFVWGVALALEYWLQPTWWAL